MKVVILEDEKSAAENLRYLLTEIDDEILVDRVVDTVSDAIDYFSVNNDIELAFCDIHLADGISFEIFEKIKVDVPLIFTTAYDEYALKAFKVNSIDYLLKPIDEDELKEAVQKFKSSKQRSPVSDELAKLLKGLATESKHYKSTFLIQKRDLLIPIAVERIAYFTIESGVVKAITFDGSTYNVDDKLEEVEAQLHPEQFFRANRQFIVRRQAIKNLTVYFNGKLIVNIEPKPQERIIVSKAKAPQLKSWMS